MRKKGSKDLKKRRTRKDKKYKYRKKSGKFQPYFSKREKGDPVKIWFWEVKPMSKEGIRRFPRHLQPTLHKKIYEKSIRVDVIPKRLSTKREIEILALEVLGYEGMFYLMMFCKRKNQFGVSPVKVCSLKISNSLNGLKAKFLENFRLYRYWFWMEGKKRFLK